MGGHAQEPVVQLLSATLSDFGERLGHVAVTRRLSGLTVSLARHEPDSAARTRSALHPGSERLGVHATAQRTTVTIP
jgi:hypothetical protein